jgi:5'(3')-deoxyribonucleotidase
MKIGIDIDEVIADFLSGMIDYHNKNYGTNLKPEDFKSYDFWHVWGGSKEDTIAKVFEFYESDVFKNLNPIDDSISAVNQLMSDFEIAIITARPEHISKYTEQWLEKHFSNKIEIHHTTDFYKNSGKPKKKSDVCKENGIDVFIDDSLRYALDCFSDKTKVLLFGNYPWNQCDKLSEGIVRAHTWDDVLKEIYK